MSSRFALMLRLRTKYRGHAAFGITIGASNPSSTRLDAEARGLPPLVRASPHDYNTEADIDRLLACLAAL
jgi:selenocysteine lyase/cysteine desulfurase